jgi:hypothetical protein
MKGKAKRTPSLVNSSGARIVAQKAHCWRRKGSRSVVDLYIGVGCRCFDLANRFSR